MNQRGQALIEYLIIIAIVAIGSISVMSVVSHNLRVRLASVATALGGQQKTYAPEAINRKDISKKNLGNFMHGAGE